MLNLALTKDPDNASIKVTIAELVHAQGDTASAITLLDSLDSEGSKLDAAVKLRAAIKLAEQLAELPALEEVEQRLLKNPLDLEALLFKSRHLTAHGDYDSAMACLLTIVRTDRGFEDDIGRVSLLALFDLLGGEHPSVQTCRRKLFTLLH
jgi:putative thioredoxin